MYPGYSPADHVYGKAAEEYGKVAAEAKKQGIDISHPEVDYEIGQAKGIKRRTLAEMRKAMAEKGQGSGSGSGSASEGPAKSTPKENATPNGKLSTENVQEATPAPEGQNPYFVIDTKPTPVNLPGISSQPIKRSASPPPSVGSTKHKKVKKHHDGELPKGRETEKVEFEDISGEVDARMKEREAKRKRKEEKKRKRESEDEPTAATETAGTGTAAPAADAEVEKPKKKAKKSNDEALADGSVSKRRKGEENEESEDGEGKKRKKRKKDKGTNGGA